MTKVKEHIEQNINWILPEKNLSHDEFLAGIKKAENGSFHSVQESMDNFEKWLKSKEKK
ncbi:MAG: hypothetical protein HOA61_09190 [Bacteroidetes bacterium]|jgi:hypothetical protein|nr:hypothetical protein [Bacteroidota bacterium]MBT5530734.1 hypothetical protein [Cytophagia bacterium]MBT4968607.1 hypothetical protein [Bacteroidota bacterium]MBT5990203.1 hypothetical protein [Bacteroidota bacterium]MBT6836206.1 hypothetical protein [Bacteroidota bacterium]